MPVVKWYRYSFPINNSDDFKITTENGRSTLTVIKACPDDTGIFSCIIENLAGASKSSTNLNVVESGQEYVLQASTRTMRKLQEMSVNAGDNIRFDIQFTAGDKSQLEFFHDGRPIKEEEEGVKILFVNDLATLLIENASSKHSGLYECLMKTPGGEARCQVSCRVVEAAKVESRMEAASQSKMASSSLTKIEGSSQTKMETSNQSKMEGVSQTKMAAMSQSKMESSTSTSSSKMMASTSSTSMTSSQERKSSLIVEQKITQQQ